MKIINYSMKLETNKKIPDILEDALIKKFVVSDQLEYEIINILNRTDLLDNLCDELFHIPLYHQKRTVYTLINFI